jgi:hypothetical protein
MFDFGLKEFLMFDDQIYLLAICFISSALGITYIYDFFKKRKVKFFSEEYWDGSKSGLIGGKILAIWFHIFLSFIALLSSTFFTVCVLNVNDPELFPDGNYCYYVEATNEKGKTYTLPAHIIKYEGEFSVRKVFFKNGGYLYFDDYCYDYVNFDQTFFAFDQDERSWDIKFTTKKAHDYRVNETEIEFNSGDAFWFSLFAIQIIEVILHLISFSKLRFDEFGNRIT